VTTIVDVINPVLGTVVSAEGLGVFEGSPHAIHEPPHRIVLNLIQDPMCRHDLHDVVTIFGAMHQESLSFHLLNKHLHVTQWLRRHVAVNVVAGNVLRPILLLLDLELAMDAKLLKSHHSHCNAKAAVIRDKLARTMNGLRRVEQKVDCLRVPLRLVLAWEGPSPVGLLQAILSLDDLDPPHDRLPEACSNNNGRGSVRGRAIAAVVTAATVMVSTATTATTTTAAAAATTMTTAVTTRTTMSVTMTTTTATVAMAVAAATQ